MTARQQRTWDEWIALVETGAASFSTMTLDHTESLQDLFDSVPYAL